MNVDDAVSVDTQILALSRCPVPGVGGGGATGGKGMWSRLRSCEGSSDGQNKKAVVAVGALTLVVAGVLAFAYCHPKGKEW